MIVALLGLFYGLKPLEFPSEPIAFEQARGEKVYYQGRGLERVLGEDRQVIGLWFDGRIRRDVDDVVWLSPSLVSRWLGYLNAKEKWSKGELLARWRTYRQDFNGRITFVVRLNAFPRQDPLDFGSDRPANASEAESPRFLATFTALTPLDLEDHEEAFRLPWAKTPQQLERYQPGVALLGSYRAYDWRPLLERQFYRLSTAFAPLLPEFEAPEVFNPYENRLGPFRSAIYIVQIPIPKEPIWDRQLELRVFTPEKERVAPFSLTAWRPKR